MITIDGDDNTQPDIIFHSDFKFNLKQDLGDTFYEILSETISDDDLRLMISVLKAEQNTAQKVNNQIKESIKNVIFTFMLLYGDCVNQLKKEQEDKREKIISTLNEIKMNKSFEKDLFITGVIGLYNTIKNRNFWQRAKTKKEYSRRRAMTSKIFDEATSLEKYYEFLIHVGVIQENLFTIGIKKKVSNQEIIDLCNNEYNKTNKYIDLLTNYATEQLF